MRLGSCRWGVLVLILAPRSRPHGERGGVRGKERRAQGRARRMGAGYACRAGYEADGEELQRYGGSAARFYWAARYRPMKSYPIRYPNTSSFIHENW